MPYNFIRDLVNRYVNAVKIYDEQLEAAVRMNQLTSDFFDSELSLSIRSEDKDISRAEFKKDLQKSGWKFIFSKMDMGKYITQGVRDDINKFIEQQTQIPFTMKNIYRMLDIIVGTWEQNMDKALESLFDKLTHHYHDNRYNLPGWKTNSHYLLGEKFILPRMCEVDKWHTGNKLQNTYGAYFDFMEDFVKALCFITGDKYSQFGSLSNVCRYNHRVYYKDNVEFFSSDIHYGGALNKVKELKEKGQYDAHYIHKPAPVYGEWFDWAYFEVKAFKKGTMHFKFKDQNVWALFNQRIAKIKGYPLYESVKKEQPKKAERKPQDAPKSNPVVLATIKLKAA